jgi:predicted nuclease of predicted toxin-antitoxin system
MLAYYMDHQVRAEITHGLRHRDVDVLTAFDDGRSDFEDADLLDRAGVLERVFVSQDHDLLRIAQQRQHSGQPFFGIAFLEQERIHIGRAVEYLELMAHVMSEAEVHSHVEFVPMG